MTVHGIGAGGTASPHRRETTSRAVSCDNRIANAQLATGRVRDLRPSAMGLLTGQERPVSSAAQISVERSFE
jgi:hypothetical protein